MLDILMSFIAPHYCSGCGLVGSSLCDNCKYDIIDELKSTCLLCKRPCGSAGVCKQCSGVFERAWCVGNRDGVLQRLVGLYKFERMRSAYRVLGDLILDRLPDLPFNTVLVPVPTVSGHIRERGYDHMRLIAKYIARRRKLSVSYVLYRKTQTKQRQASAKQREAQARRAFGVKGGLDSKQTYLLIDDVVTTGSTIKYAAKALRAAGAKHIWVAVIARQTLD